MQGSPFIYSILLRLHANDTVLGANDSSAKKSGQVPCLVLVIRWRNWGTGNLSVLMKVSALVSGKGTWCDFQSWSSYCLIMILMRACFSLPFSL